MQQRLNFVLLSSLLLTAQVHAQESGVNEAPDLSASLPVSVRLGYEQLKLPKGEKMGLVGTSYLLHATPEIEVGPSVYGSITGQRGGFYTIGMEADWHRALFSNVEVQTGMFVGAGGGSPPSVGGGLMLRPHVDLLWNFSGVRTGFSYSSVSFKNGFVNSRQFGMLLSLDTDFVYLPREKTGMMTSVRARQGIGFDRVIAVVGSYRSKRGAVSPSIGYAGARLDHFLTPHTYWGIETSGAASGNASGYAEFLGTMGAETPLLGDWLTVGTRAAVGMGGGNPTLIDVGGGQLNKFGVYATANLTRDTHFSLDTGYVQSPGGLFRASYGSANLIIDLDHPYGQKIISRAGEYEWMVGTEHYYKVLHYTAPRDTLNGLVMKANIYLDKNIYLAGQAHAAYGGLSGGYAVGLFGMGYRFDKTRDGLYWGGDMLVGAAGGGLVDAGGGAVTQPMLYVGMDINKAEGIRLGFGKVKSLQGRMNSPVVDLTYNIAYGAAGR